VFRKDAHGVLEDHGGFQSAFGPEKAGQLFGRNRLLCTPVAEAHAFAGGDLDVSGGEALVIAVDLTGAGVELPALADRQEATDR
jgi:hypothetical protein